MEALFKLQSLVLRARSAMDREDWVGALTLLGEIESEADSLHVSKASALHSTSIALDMTGRSIEALEAVSRSIALDPTSAATLRSREIIVENLRERVHSLAPPEERHVAFNALSEHGAANSADCLAEIALLEQEGKRAAALTLAVGLMSVAPTKRVIEVVARLKAEVPS